MHNRPCFHINSSSRFDKTSVSMAVAELGQEHAPLVNVEPYFVDFLREPPEAMGDEPDDFDFSAPKIYEAIPSFDFLKDRLLS